MLRSDCPYWFSESVPERYLSRQTPTLHSTQGDGRIVIIGGGLSGVLLAYFLACRRACTSLVLIEEREVCGGSSGRMGGHFWPIGPCPPHALVQSLDLATAREIYQFGYDAFDDFIAFMQRRPDMAQEVQFVKGKGLDLLAPESLVSSWQSSISELCPIMQARGVSMQSPTQIAADHGLRAFEDSTVSGKFDGGLYDPNTCQFSPVLLAVYMLQLIEKTCAESNGAIAFECLPRTRVSQLVRGSGPGARFQVRTHVGDTLSAHLVVHCTNLIHTSLLPPGLDDDYRALSVSPIRGQMIVTEPVPVSPPFTHIGSLCYNSFDVYITRLLSKDDASRCRYLVGGQSNADEMNNADDTHTTGRVTNKLESFIRKLLDMPQLRIDYRFSGIMGVTPDALPIVGQVASSPGEWVVFGTSPVGTVHLWGMAQALAADMSGLSSSSKLMLPNSYRLERFIKASRC